MNHGASCPAGDHRPGQALDHALAQALAVLKEAALSMAASEVDTILR